MLRPVEIPAGYWINLSLFMTAMVAILGGALGCFLLYFR